MTSIITSPAQEEKQIELMLERIEEKKLKLMDVKYTLKHYKIQSDRLDSLKKAKKELHEQVKEEEKKIEDLFYKDADFEKAKNDELTLKNEIKESVGELKQIIKNKHKVSAIVTEEYLANSQQLKLQLDFSPKVYINGKELK